MPAAEVHRAGSCGEEDNGLFGRVGSTLHAQAQFLQRLVRVLGIANSACHGFGLQDASYLPSQLPSRSDNRYRGERVSRAGCRDTAIMCLLGWWQQESQRAISTEADEDACSDCISVSRASHHAQHHLLTDTEDSVMQVRLQT